jgi:hypothetical protein
MMQSSLWSRCATASWSCRLEEFLEVFVLQFAYGLFQDLVVGLEADVVDEAALFRAEQVARATDVQVLHGDVDAAAQVAELLDGLQAFAAEVGQQVRAGCEQVAVGLLVAAAHATAQLVQIAEAEVLRLVHDDRVRVRDVQPFSTMVVQTSTSVLPSMKSSITSSSLWPSSWPWPTPTRAGHQLADHVGDELDVLHLVVQEVDLAAA